MTPEREKYFESIKKNQIDWIQIPQNLLEPLLIAANFSEIPTTVFLLVAGVLEKMDMPAAKTRAKFIRIQCEDEPNKDLQEIFYYQHCESWGIPIFQEELVSWRDFEKGFMRRFRDHTTSYGEDFEARNWFFTAFEPQFIKQYEFWHCDNGVYEEFEDMKLFGNYKSILIDLLFKQQELGVFKSPAFNKKELVQFLQKIKKTDPDFYEEMSEEIEEYLNENPIFKSS